jgi:hypothetical protein
MKRKEPEPLPEPIPELPLEGKKKGKTKPYPPVPVAEEDDEYVKTFKAMVDLSDKFEVIIRRVRVYDWKLEQKDEVIEEMEERLKLARAQVLDDGKLEAGKIRILCSSDDCPIFLDVDINEWVGEDERFDDYWDWEHGVGWKCGGCP